MAGILCKHTSPNITTQTLRNRDHSTNGRADELSATCHAGVNVSQSNTERPRSPLGQTGP
jgi:hypothetical protein